MLTFILYLILILLAFYVIVTAFVVGASCILYPVNCLLNIGSDPYGTGHDNKHKYPQSQSEEEEYWARNEAFKAKHGVK